MVIIFRNATVANSLMQEIAVLPSGTWLWMGPKVVPGSDFETQVGDPEGTPNVITYAQDNNGLCAVCHPFGEEDVTFLTEYMADAIAAGDVRLLDALPGDWVCKED